MADRIARLVGLSEFAPLRFDKRGLVGSAMVSAIQQSAGASPALGKLTVHGAIKAWEAIGTRRFISLHLKSCKHDVELALGPENLAEFDAAYRVSFGQETEATLVEVKLASAD